MEKAVTGIIEIESTLTDSYQTAVPEAVRRALLLSKGDNIRYSIRPSGEVVLSRAEVSKDDRVMDHFLTFLVREIDKRPHHLQPLDADFAKDIQSLVEGVEIDLHVPLAEGDK